MMSCSSITSSTFPPSTILSLALIEMAFEVLIDDNPDGLGTELVEVVDAQQGTFNVREDLRFQALHFLRSNCVSVLSPFLVPGTPSEYQLPIHNKFIYP
jgi:hypothetical protein